MPKFTYKAKDTAGANVEGVKYAVVSQDVVNALQNQGFTQIVVNEAKGESAKSRAKTAKEAVSHGGVKQQDITIFCRQMATMINAGVTIIEALDDLADMTVSAKLRSILKNIANDIRGGLTFSASLKKHPKVFDKVFISIIAAGEESGQLGKILKDLALHLENSMKLKRKIQAASAYPLFITGFFVVVLLGIVLFIVPQFKSLFASVGAELPLPTQIVMGTSEFLIKNFWLVIIFIVLIIVGYRMINSTKPGKFVIDSIKLKLPIAGDIITKSLLTRFFQTLATLLRSGVDVVMALDLASRVVNNLPLEQNIDNIRKGIVEGSSLASIMGQLPIFPKMATRMVAVGEKTGQLDEMIDVIADYYDSEIDAIVAGMSSIIEPILIIMLGFLVGLVVIALYLPIFKVAMATGGGSGM
ncbi:MAG: type II secretion system F family protein [Elusimicrobiota bacterium]